MDLTVKRYEKRIIKMGVPKQLAREIAETAVETGGCKAETYIDYAMKLVYGMSFKMN